MHARAARRPRGSRINSAEANYNKSAPGPCGNNAQGEADTDVPREIADVESYLDTGNRSFFAKAGVVALAGIPDGARAHAEFCRPFVAAGPVVEAVRARLATRVRTARRAA